MLRIVSDTNVLISALGWKGNEYVLIENCFDKKILLILSLNILDEFKEVVSRSEFNFVEEEIDEFINALIEVAIIVQPTEKVTACRDSEDDKFLETALEGKAYYIVSGDKDLLSIRSFRAVRIVTTVGFLQIVNKSTKK